MVEVDGERKLARIFEFNGTEAQVRVANLVQLRGAIIVESPFRFRFVVPLQGVKG